MQNYSNNPYASAGYGNFAAQASESERAGFIRNTYIHLFGALLAFAAIEFVILNLVPAATLTGLVGMMAGYGWLVVLVAFMVVSWIARSWAESSTSKGLQYAGLGLYVVAEAIIFLPLLYYADLRCGGEVIASAGILTLTIFGGLTFIVFFSRADFSFLRMFLCWGGIIAIGLVVCAVVFGGFSLGIWFSVLMIGLASGYILYDTSNVLHHYRTDQYVAASLALFASVAILFWYVLRLLMSMRDD